MFTSLTRLVYVPLYLFLVGLLSPVQLRAQQNVRFTHITTGDGLSQSTVLCMLKDKYGLMWFGTDDGLDKYDGYHFTDYRNRVNDRSSLVGNSITSLFEDKAGNLWIGTKEGLSRYNHEKDSFTNYFNVPGNP